MHPFQTFFGSYPTYFFARFAFKRGDVVPQFHYETRAFRNRINKISFDMIWFGFRFRPCSFAVLGYDAINFTRGLCGKP